MTVQPARAELGAALNDEFGKLPPGRAGSHGGAGGRIDAALDGEDGLVVDAIRHWEQRHLELFDEAPPVCGGIVVIAWRPWPWLPPWPEYPAPQPAGDALR
jgi:hypothetical protein